jgi:pimeloyl-ACP methyl ester carboxylesterase
VEVTDQDRREVAERRRAEPWFPDAFAAFERIWAGGPADADWAAITPFTYGRWDAGRAGAPVPGGQPAQQRRGAVLQRLTNADGALDPVTTRKAVAEFGKPVLLLAGEYDIGLPPRNAAECAGLFEHAESAPNTRVRQSNNASVPNSARSHG